MANGFGGVVIGMLTLSDVLVPVPIGSRTGLSVEVKLILWEPPGGRLKIESVLRAKEVRL